MGPDEQREWLFRPARGRAGGTELSGLHPSEEEDRRRLIEAEHAELLEALDDDIDEIEVGGRPVSPRLHLAMHEVVASQLWNDDPPEMWPTAERLVTAGYERHEVLHMLGSVVVGELWHVRTTEEPFDRERYAAALAALPASWERARADDELAESPWSGPPPDGTTLTHRLTGAEVAGGFVAYAPDLEPLDPLLGEHGHLHLAGGQVAEPRVDDDAGRVLVGPPGWLGPGGPDELVGFRVAGQEVEVVAVTAPSPPDDLRERLLAVFEQANEGDGMPVTVAELVNGAIAGLPGPEPPVLPPVGELLTGCGFEVRDGYAAPEGTDWESFERICAVAATAALRDLDPNEAHALVMLCELYRLFVEGELSLEGADRGMLTEVAEMLADADMGEAFVETALAASDAVALLRFVDTVGRGTGSRHRAGLAWVGAAAARHAGDHERAEALLRRGLEAEPGHRVALWDAAWYASDRGDARRAFGLLERLAQLGDEEAEERAALLRSYVHPPAELARRNDPCPCGSGRKHKHCCLGGARTAPLPERVRWIWEKLDWFLSRSGFEDDVEEVADALGSGAPQDELLAASLVLFQDGAVDDFLRLRGPLLPDDERNLVAQWAFAGRSVHEVVAVEPGAGMRLSDVRTGDVLQVRERLGSAQLAVGDLVCAHVVPDGVTNQIVGGIMPVPLRLRDHLIAALDEGLDAAELAEVVGAAWAPPELRNMEGEPVVACEARYEVTDRAAVAALDDVLDVDDDGLWSEPVEAEGRTWVRGTVAVDGAELVVSANSEGRFSRLRERVEAAVPGLELVAESATPVAQTLARGEHRLPPPMAGQLPPEAADALAAFVREQEERWLDEPVPALGRLTPRQAAADPTRREQLRALLHEFDHHPPPPGAATFDTGRLRARLGLDEG